MKILRYNMDPTSIGDTIAEDARRWYEANRESWWDRHRPGADREGWHADEFMLAFCAEVRRLEKEMDDGL